MTDPAISVIIPAHNRAHLIGRAIESVLAQSFADLELIVIDDASSDDTAAAAERYAADPRLRVIRNARNLGAGASRNRGVAEARAPVAAFQDSDDRWLPEKLARQYAALGDGPGGMAYCGAVYVGGREAHYLPAPRFGRLSGDMREAVLGGNPVSTQTLMVRTALFRDLGGFDPALSQYEDWEFAIRLAAATPFAFVEEPLVLIYRTPGSLSDNRLTDAVSRRAIVERHAAAYARRPDEAARQFYILGRLWSGLRDQGAARRALWRAFRLKPGAKTAAALGLAALRALGPRGAGPRAGERDETLRS